MPLKQLFHELLEINKNAMFEGAVVVLKQHIVDATQSVREALDDHLERVAMRVRRISEATQCADEWLLILLRFAGRDAHGGALGVSLG